MKNSVQEGKVLEFAAPAGGVVSGKAYLIGALVCVSMSTVAAGVQASFYSEGVFELTKETTADFSEGDRVFLDSAGDGDIDEKAAGRFFAGTCTKAAGAGVLLCDVKLAGFGVIAEV